MTEHSLLRAKIDAVGTTAIHIRQLGAVWKVDGTSTESRAECLPRGFQNEHAAFSAGI